MNNFFDLAWTQIRFIQLSDAITFKIDTETDGCYLMRIHINGMNKEEIPHAPFNP